MGVAIAACVSAMAAGLGPLRPWRSCPACARVRFFLGLCCHMIPHKPSRFRLLLVMLKLLTINDTLVASTGFCSRFPAKPLPAWTSASKSLSMMVEDSMFFTAALRVGVLVATSWVKSPPTLVSCWEKRTRLLPEMLRAGALEVTSAFRSSTVVMARSETVRRLATAIERFVSV